MIGACSILRRKPADNVEKFNHHWLTVHGPLAAELHGVRRYLQSHFRNDSDLTNDLGRSFDVNGLAEMWFENEVDRQICYDSEQEKVCDVDSLLFIGATARVVTDVVQHVRLSGTPCKHKQVFLFVDGADAGKSIDFKQLAGIGGISGLTEHVVHKAGAEPTQARERVDVNIRRIVTVGSDDADAIRTARSMITDEGRRTGIAAFDCTEYYLV